MPQPTFAIDGTTHYAICKFGNNALPNGQGTMSWINLNDVKQWLLQSGAFDYANRQLGIAQSVYLAKSTYVSDDWQWLDLSLPFIYSEDTSMGGTGAPIGSLVAQLMMAGEQYLTFDNQTALLVKVQGIKNRKMLRSNAPWLWSLELALKAKSPWFSDITATTTTPTALSSGVATSFNTTYAGSVWCEPTWTLTIPNTNTAPIQSFALQNTMGGDSIAVVFANSLAASTAWTISINSSTLSITDQNGAFYDPQGSFVYLYGPAGQANAMSATLTPASGTATGCTISATYNNRWML